MNCSPSGFSVHGNSPARILQWIAIPFSRGSSQPRDRTLVSCTAGRFYTILSYRKFLLLYSLFQAATLGSSMARFDPRLLFLLSALDKLFNLCESQLYLLKNEDLLHRPWGFPGGSNGKEPACQCRRLKEPQARSLGLEVSLEKEMATHSSIPAWKIPWTEEHGRLQSTV